MLFRVPYNDVSDPQLYKRYVLRMDDRAVHIRFDPNGPSRTVEYVQANGEYYIINDGQWYYIMVTFNHTTGELIVYANNVKVGEDVLPEPLVWE